MDYEDKLIVGFKSGLIKLIDLTIEKETDFLDCQDEIIALKLEIDSLIALSTKGHLYAWDLHSGKNNCRFINQSNSQFPSKIKATDLDQVAIQGKWVAYSLEAKTRVRVYNLATGQVLFDEVVRNGFQHVLWEDNG